MNTVKVREDKGPIKFEKDESEKGTFKVKDGASSYITNDGTFTEIDLRSRVEPWLSSLFQSVFVKSLC